MNSEIKTAQCDKWCSGCEEWTDELKSEHGVELCTVCDGAYFNETGYCSMHCCLGGGCDDAC
jgi:hypothetical protein